MKIINPQYEILPDNIPLDRRVEECGRICYKSEDKMKALSAPGFCKAMVQHAHNSVLEMGILTVEVSNVSEKAYHLFMCTDRKYITVDNTGPAKLLITGSVRAFREGFAQNPNDIIWKTIFSKLLSSKHGGTFFVDLEHMYMCDDNHKFYTARIVPLAELRLMSPEIIRRHYHVAVKFIVNRAVTHEIVRHRPCAFLQESQRYCRYSEDKFGGEVAFIKPMFWKEDTPEYEEWKRAMLLTEDIYLNLLKTSSPQAARTVLPNSCKTELIVYCNLVEWHHIFHMRAVNPKAEPSMREIMIPVHEEFKNRLPNQDFGEPRRMPEGYI